MAGSTFTPGNTLMTNSAVGDDWIRRACVDNPTKKADEGYIISGPVRLAFCDTTCAAGSAQRHSQVFGVCAVQPIRGHERLSARVLPRVW